MTDNCLQCLDTRYLGVIGGVDVAVALLRMSLINYRLQSGKSVRY